MFSKLKYAVLAAGVAMTPMSAQALAFYTNGAYETTGSVYEIGSGLKKINALAVHDLAAGTFTVTVQNNKASTFNFEFGETYYKNTLAGFSLTFDGVAITAPFTVALNAGDSKDLVFTYGVQTKGLGLGATLASIPLPASGALLVGALGAAALLRRRKSGAAAV